MTATLLVLFAWIDLSNTVPSGFSDKQLFKGTHKEMTSIAFSSQGEMFVTTRLGIVDLYEPGNGYEYIDKTPKSLILLTWFVLSNHMPLEVFSCTLTLTV